MIKCLLCDLHTKLVNGLMTKHYKIHLSDSYSKDNYKRDLLISLGREPKVCDVCDLETKIPKGENEYPHRHRACHLKSLEGDNNPNYRGGKLEISCAHCNEMIIKHSSQLQGNKKFCSTKCAMNFYALPQNRTEAQKTNDINAANILREQNNTDKLKIARAKAISKMQEERKSGVETKVLEAVKLFHPDAVGSHVLGFYTWDIYIPSSKVLLEVHGNYWHNMPKIRSADRRKALYAANNLKEYEVLSLWESEIKDLDPKHLLEHAAKPIKVWVLCGPPGCGKSYLTDQLNESYQVVNYDEIVLDTFKVSDKPILIVTATKAKLTAKMLRSKGTRVGIVMINESVDAIESRLASRGELLSNSILKRINHYNNLKDRISNFYGSQDEVKAFLLNLP